jgi:hypothetical protein
MSGLTHDIKAATASINTMLMANGFLIAGVITNHWPYFLLGSALIVASYVLWRMIGRRDV